MAGLGFHNGLGNTGLKNQQLIVCPVDFGSWTFTSVGFVAPWFVVLANLWILGICGRWSVCSSRLIPLSLRLMVSFWGFAKSLCEDMVGLQVDSTNHSFFNQLAQSFDCFKWNLFYAVPFLVDTLHPRSPGGLDKNGRCAFSHAGCRRSVFGIGSFRIPRIRLWWLFICSQLVIGEAANPGPDQWNLGVFNPSGLNAKLDQISFMHGDIWMGCETHLTKVGISKFRRGLRALKAPFRYFVHGAPCPPRGDSQVGSFTGVSVVSRFPARPLPHSITAFSKQAGFKLQGSVCITFGSIWELSMDTRIVLHIPIELSSLITYWKRW